MKPEIPVPCVNKVARTRTTRRRSNVGFKCSTCQRNFPSVVRLRRHLNVVHKNSGRLFCCRKCNISFDELSVFLQHSRGHKFNQQQTEFWTDSNPDHEPHASGEEGNGNDNDSVENTSSGDKELGDPDSESEQVYHHTLGANGYGSAEQEQSNVREECEGTKEAEHQNQSIIQVQNQDLVQAIQMILPMENNEVGLQVGDDFNQQPTMAKLNHLDALSAAVSSPAQVTPTPTRAKQRNSHKKARMICNRIAKNARSQRQKTKSRSSVVEMTRQETRSELESGNDSFNIGLPHNVRTVNLMSSSSSEDSQGKAERAEIMKYLDNVNRKLDSIIRHFNVPYSEKNWAPSRRSQTPAHNSRVASSRKTSASWENLTSSPSMVSNAAQNHKERDQDYLTTDSGAYDNGANVYVTEATDQAYHNQSIEAAEGVEDSESYNGEIRIPTEIVEKMRSRSLNRGNFAKHLTFHLFPLEERMGKNCFGRRAGVQSGPKGRLDPNRMEVVKKLAFQYYPCPKEHEDTIWRRECVISIDTGLRGENRALSLKRRSQTQGEAPMVVEKMES